MNDRDLADALAHSMIRDGQLVKVNKKNLKLINNIEIFKKEILKREINGITEGNHGVFFFPYWDHKYGFYYKLQGSDAIKDFSFERQKEGFTFEEHIQATKKQIAVFRKARHNLACLIRLKNKLGLPGPVQKTAFTSIGVGYQLLPLSQEEIDDILKY